MKKSRPHLDAIQDVESGVEYYARENIEIAKLFIEEYRSAIKIIERLPGIGSLRFSVELNIPEIQTYSLRKFPYLIFYIERDKYIDIVRVLHMSRDVHNLPTLEE